MAALTLAVLTALAASAQAFQIYPRDRNVTCLQVIGTPADGALLNV
jgi:hypothetical protein